MVAGADSRLPCPASGGISGCPKRRQKEKWENGPRRLAQAHKRSAHDDGGVTCDIVVVVGTSSLVPLLKWACAHQAGSRFQNRKNDGG